MDQSAAFDYRGLDGVIHSRIRLSIMAILASVDDATFTHLRDEIGLTDGNLSTHMSKLVEAGYVETHRVLDAGRAATRYRLTPDGRNAFGDYLTRLENLLGGLQP